MSARYSEPAFGSRPVRQSTSRPQAAAATIGAPGIFCYSIQAQAEPGVMPRVLALFAKRNLVPMRWHSDVLGGAGHDLAIDVQVKGLSPDVGNYIASCLRQIPGVATVLTAEKRVAVERDPGALSA
jgi:hypothetical protein